MTRRLTYVTAVVVLTAAAACSDDKVAESIPQQTPPEDLGQSLANSTENYQPVRFVSAVEQVSPKPRVAVPRPTDVVRPHTDTTHAEPQPEPSTQDSVSAVAALVIERSAPRIPMIVTRDAEPPDPVEGAGSGWRASEGPALEPVIGVVFARRAR
jgi:hypothetical protein